MTAPPFSAWERSLAMRYLRARRSQGGVAMISIISFVGITLAVAALIIVMSIMNGFRSELVGKMLGFNGHAFILGVPISPASQAATVRRLRAVPGVTEAAPVVQSEALVQGPASYAGVIVRGVAPEDLRANRLLARNIKSGTLRDFGQGEDGGDVVVIGDKLAEKLDIKVGDDLGVISPSGDDTAFGSFPTRKTYTVGAIFSVGMSQYDEGFIYMPMAQAQLFFGRGTAVDFVEVKVTDPDKVASMIPALEAAAPGTTVDLWTQRDQAFFGALQVERTAMRIIFMFVVAIAAMNIISGLVMLVKNKSRDIAILRTMGAGRGSVMRIFFMAGAVIGVLATAAGLVFGIVFCANIETIQRFVEWVTGANVFNADIYFLSHVPAKIDWTEVAIVTVWTLAASFVAALPQAWHASRLDPVEALRYE